MAQNESNYFGNFIMYIVGILNDKINIFNSSIYGCSFFSYKKIRKLYLMRIR